MKIVDCGPQRSDSWKAYRRTKCMASEVAAIMGKSPWLSAEDVFFEKLGLGKERVVNAAMQHGIDNESTTLAMLNEKIGVEFKPCVVESEKHPWLGASLDGYFSHHAVGSWICEIKCPSSDKPLLEAKQEIIPEYYRIQIQVQMLCSEADLCFYCVYYQGEIAIVEVRPDPAMQAEIIEATKEFWERVQNLDPPVPKYVETQDEDWVQAATTLSEIQERIKKLQEQEDELKSILIQISAGKSTKGHGMAVIHSVRAGAIDYAKICAERNIDTAQYRKPATQVITVRKVK